MAFKFPSVQRRPWGFWGLLASIFPGLGTMTFAARAGHMGHWALGLMQFLLLVVAVAVQSASSMTATIITAATLLWSWAWGILWFLHSK
jgi:hypothetical protein